jgi:hypothetical protein
MCGTCSARSITTELTSARTLSLFPTPLFRASELLAHAPLVCLFPSLPSPLPSLSPLLSPLRSEGRTHETRARLRAYETCICPLVHRVYTLIWLTTRFARKRPLRAFYGAIGQIRSLYACDIECFTSHVVTHTCASAQYNRIGRLNARNRLFYCITFAIAKRSLVSSPALGQTD